jgi:hypothetical protein
MGLADFLAPAAHRKTGFGAGGMSQEDLDEIARELNGPPRGRRFAPVGRPPVVLGLSVEDGMLVISAEPKRLTRVVALLLFWGSTAICILHQAGEFFGARLWPVLLGPVLFWLVLNGVVTLTNRAYNWLWLQRAQGLLERRLARG